MLKLMKLEMKKLKINRFIIGALILNLVIVAFMVPINYEDDGYFSSFSKEILLIDLSVRNAFFIFAAVMIVKFIIEEYKNNTITVLFMYPINRYKLFLSKLIIIVSFIFIAIVLSDIFIVVIFYIINTFANFVPNVLNAKLIVTELSKIIINAIATSFISLIPLFFGMIKKSGVTTIISAIVLISLIGSNDNGSSISNIIWIQLLLSAIGIFIAYLAIRNIEKRDLA